MSTTDAQSWRGVTRLELLESPWWHAVGEASGEWHEAPQSIGTIGPIASANTMVATALFNTWCSLPMGQDARQRAAGSRDGIFAESETAGAAGKTRERGKSRRSAENFPFGQ